VIERTGCENEELQVVLSAKSARRRESAIKC
jgi:hypothetical protein